MTDKYVKRLIEDYLNNKSFYNKENSNNDVNYPSMRSYLSQSIMAKYALDEIYTKELAEAHKTGAIHIHDLGNAIAGYCGGFSLRDLLLEGFNGIEGRVSSGPPKHLRTAVIQMVNFLGTVQMEVSGAVAFNSVDSFLAPYVRKLIDAEGRENGYAYICEIHDTVYAEVKQCMQELIHGLNIPSRAGEIPFSNMSFDWTISEELRNQNPIIDGVVQDYIYGDLLTEMGMINRAFIEVMTEGDSDGRNFGFPIPTYFMTKEFDYETENAKLLFELTGKYGTPYFSNFTNSDLDPTDIRSMCCRLSLDLKELRKSGGIFNSFDSTGSIGVVTINLPQIAMNASTMDEFYDRLYVVLNQCKDALELKRIEIDKVFDMGMFPYLKRWLPHKFNRHFSTIGINGMAEAMDFLDDLDPELVLDYILRVIGTFQLETGHLYNFEETPAEGACYRFAKIDNKGYDFYTQGAKLPFDHTDDLFEKLEYEEPLLQKYTGGSVAHIFVGEALTGKMVKALLKSVLTGYKVPYYTISPTFSVCKTHGYIVGEKYECPTCYEETEVYKRIVGYYSPVKRWNPAKVAEGKIRTMFNTDNI